MKRLISLVLVMILLTGCSPEVVFDSLGETFSKNDEYFRKEKTHPLGSGIDYVLEPYDIKEVEGYTLPDPINDKTLGYELGGSGGHSILYNLPSNPDAMGSGSNAMTILDGLTTNQVAMGSTGPLGHNPGGTTMALPFRDVFSISSFYGWRNVSKGSAFHGGVDMVSGTSNKSLYASGRGVVMEEGFNPSWGNYIVIEYSLFAGITGDASLATEVDKWASFVNRKDLSNADLKQLSLLLEKAEPFTKAVQDQMANKRMDTLLDAVNSRTGLTDIRSKILFAELLNTCSLRDAFFAWVRDSRMQPFIGTADEFEKTYEALKTYSQWKIAHGSMYNSRIDYVYTEIKNKSSALTGADTSSQVARDLLLDCLTKSETGYVRSDPRAYYVAGIDSDQMYSVGILQFHTGLAADMLKVLADTIRSNGSGTSTQGDTFTLMYVHMDKRSNLKRGESVTSDTVVGIQGNTGASDGAHLHLSATVNLPYALSNFNGVTPSEVNFDAASLKMVDPLSRVFGVKTKAELAAKSSLNVTCSASGQRAESLEAAKVSSNSRWANVQNWSD